jgi:hypothetical protein
MLKYIFDFSTIDCVICIYLTIYSFHTKIYTFFPDAPLYINIQYFYQFIDPSQSSFFLEITRKDPSTKTVH